VQNEINLKSHLPCVVALLISNFNLG